MTTEFTIHWGSFIAGIVVGVVSLMLCVALAMMTESTRPRR